MQGISRFSAILSDNSQNGDIPAVRLTVLNPEYCIQNCENNACNNRLFVVQYLHEGQQHNNRSCRPGSGKYNFNR